MSALHHEVLAVLRGRADRGDGPVNADRVAAVVRGRLSQALGWRRIASCLADLRRRGLVTSVPKPLGQHRGGARRGHLWSAR